jgi:hypothetical protein
MYQVLALGHRQVAADGARRGHTAVGGAVHRADHVLAEGGQPAVLLLVGAVVGGSLLLLLPPEVFALLLSQLPRIYLRSEGCEDRD